jgi:folate-binding protein YgfZ
MSEVCHLEDRAIIGVSGSDAHGWLQGLITNDIDLLSEDQSIYAALLTPQGKVLFDFFLIADGETILIDCEKSRSAELIKRLTLYKLRSAVEISAKPDLSVLAFFGEQSVALSGLAESVAGATQQAFGDTAFVDPRLANMGVRVIGDLQRIASYLETEGIVLGEMASYHQHRLALGVANGSSDIRPDNAFVLESNLDEMNGVSFSKGCYVGQEVTARTKHKGTLRKRILPLSSAEPLPAAPAPIVAGSSEIGTLLSGNGGRGLGLIRLDRWQAAQESGTALMIDGQNVEISMPRWLASEAT